MPALADVSDLADYLHMDLDSQDSAALFAVEAASAAVRTYTGQELTLVEDEEVTLDGDGSDLLLLPELPVVELTEISISDNDPLIETDDFTIDLAAGIVKRTGISSWGLDRQSVHVTYTHGYEDIPDGLRTVTIFTAARIYVQAGTSQETVGGVSQTFETTGVTFSEGEKAILDRWRVRR